MSEEIKQSAHKVRFLAEVYPKHTLADLLAVLAWSPAAQNAALWACEELNYLTLDKKTKELVRGEKPAKYDFGPNVSALEDLILFNFKHLGEQESDLEENYLVNWTQGLDITDVLIALKHLEAENKLSSYVINEVAKDEDGKEYTNDYTFFTLYENRDKQWGRKQFKKDPIVKEKQ